MEEVAAGNREFSRAEQTLRATVESIGLPEVRYFLNEFACSRRHARHEDEIPLLPSMPGWDQGPIFMRRARRSTWTR